MWDFVGLCGNLDRIWPFRNWLTALTNWLPQSCLLCIRLCIISGKISRYCYKSAILSCIYAQNGVVMHQSCIRHGIPYPPTGYICRHNVAGVTSKSIRKMKKAPLLSSRCTIGAIRGEDQGREKFSGNGNDTLLPPQTQWYQRFAGFWQQ